MDIDSLRKMPKVNLQKIAEEIARALEVKVEGSFIKGDFIELTGKQRTGEGEKDFVIVIHTGNLLREDFLNAFKKTLKKENASALLLTTARVENLAEDENLRILAGNSLVEFLEKQGIGEEGPSILPEIPEFKAEKKKQESGSALPSAGVLEKYMKAGLKFFERKEYEKALQCFEEVLQMKPGYDRAISLKARTYAAMGEKDVAIETYRKALEMMPDKYELWYEYADLLHELEMYDEELECYAKILEENKKLDKVWNNMGIVYFIKERYEDALFCFEKASKLKPDNPDYLNNIATAQKKLGKTEEALATYRKVLEIAPEHGDALLNTGILYNETKKFEEAYRTFKKYLQKEKTSARGWHLAGISAMNAGAYSQAIKCFEEALRLSPDLKEAKEGLREAKRKFSQKGDKLKISEVEESKLLGAGVSQKEEAEEAKAKPEVVMPAKGVEEPKEVIPEQPAVAKVEERTLPPESAGQEKAQASFASLVAAIAKGAMVEEKKPKKADASEIWGYIRSGKFEEAAQMLNQFDLKANAGIALGAGFVYANLGEYQKAVDYFEHVLSGQKMNIPANFGKEVCEFYLAKYDEALATLDLLLKKFPHNTSLLLKKCLLLYVKRNFDECESELKRIAKDLQHSEFYWYLLARVNLEKGNKEFALKCFENVLRLNPNFTGAKKKIEELGGSKP